MTGAMGVLVVSGDGGTVDELKGVLRALEYTFYSAGSMAEAKSIAERHPLSVVLADVRGSAAHPAGVLTQLRRHTAAPVLMLTGNDSEMAGQCLELGAEDCIAWPAAAREVIARIRLRTQNGNGAHHDINGASNRLDLHRDSRTAVVDGQSVELTHREFELLSFMASFPGVAFTADQLLDAVWGSTRDWQSISTIREHVYRLRHKLEHDPSSPQLIVTDRGRGYRLEI